MLRYLLISIACASSRDAFYLRSDASGSIVARIRSRRARKDFFRSPSCRVDLPGLG